MRTGGSGNLLWTPSSSRQGRPRRLFHLAAHSLGERPLALRITARVEPPHRAWRRAGADKGGVRLGEQAHGDVVADIARRLDAGGLAGEPGLHQVGGETRFLIGPERVRDHEPLEREPFPLGIERG
jgi:hypothetical protein